MINRLCKSPVTIFCLCLSIISMSAPPLSAIAQSIRTGRVGATNVLRANDVISVISRRASNGRVIQDLVFSEGEHHGERMFQFRELETNSTPEIIMSGRIYQTESGINTLLRDASSGLELTLRGYESPQRRNTIQYELSMGNLRSNITVDLQRAVIYMIKSRKLESKGKINDAKKMRAQMVNTISSLNEYLRFTDQIENSAALNGLRRLGLFFGSALEERQEGVLTPEFLALSSAVRLFAPAASPNVEQPAIGGIRSHEGRILSVNENLESGVRVNRNLLYLQSCSGCDDLFNGALDACLTFDQLCNLFGGSLSFCQDTLAACFVAAIALFIRCASKCQ